MVRRQALSMRRRVRRWGSAKGLAITRMVGRHPLLAGGISTITATVMAALTFQTLYAGRVEELRHAGENSHNVVATISADLARNIELYDLSLQAVVSGAQDAQTWKLPMALRQRVLFDRSTGASTIAGAYVVDVTGRVKASQNTFSDRSLSFAQRDYFTVQRDNPNVQLYLSRPFHSMARHGALSVALSRRINGAGGQFDGVAMLAVRIEYFQHLLDSIDVGRHGSVFIYLRAGMILAGKPMPPGGVDADYSATPSIARMREHASGTFMMRTRMDGIERVYTYAHVENAPLTVVICPAVEDVLANWRQRSRIAIALTVVLGSAYVALSWLLSFALRDKLLAEAELTRLALTDPLTGIANRRALDQRLAAEWQRAAREATPLSLLFIDVDHFKLFNDAYGHATGDEVLGLVAERITSATRRATDFVARYGGEEFVVILPGTPADGAAKIAEKVRRRVEAMQIEHPEAPFGRVTVSVGAATCPPPAGGSSAKLLGAADQQAYEAKAAGRNRVRTIVLCADSFEPPQAAPQGTAT